MWLWAQSQTFLCLSFLIPSVGRVITPGVAVGRAHEVMQMKSVSGTKPTFRDLKLGGSRTFQQTLVSCNRKWGGAYQH